MVNRRRRGNAPVAACGHASVTEVPIFHLFIDEGAYPSLVCLRIQALSAYVFKPCLLVYSRLAVSCLVS